MYLPCYTYCYIRILFCIVFSITVLLTFVVSAYTNEVYIIEYGDIISEDIVLTTPISSVVFEGSTNAEDRGTVVSADIKLSGITNSMHVQNAIISGNLFIGTPLTHKEYIHSTATMVLKNITLEGSITLENAKNALYYGTGISLATGTFIGLTGSNNTLVMCANSIMDGASISIGSLSEISNNVLTFMEGGTLLNTQMYLTGNTTVDIAKNVTFDTNTQLVFTGSAKVQIHEARDFSSLFNFSGVDGELTLVLGSGFSYEGTIAIPDSFATSAQTKTLTLSGADIIGDIYIPEKWKVSWGGTQSRFVGNIYIQFEDSKKLVGVGIAEDSCINYTGLLPDNFSLYVAKGTVWNGSIAGSGIELFVDSATIRGSIALEASSSTIVDSTIHGSIVLNSTEQNSKARLVRTRLLAEDTTNFIALSMNSASTHVDVVDSTIVGNILNTAGGSITLDANTFAGEYVYVDAITISNGITMGSAPDTTQYIVGNTITIEKSTKKNPYTPIFMARNGIAGDADIRVHGALVEKQSKDSIFFDGDIDFTTGKADTINLENASLTSAYSRYVAFTLTAPIQSGVVGQRIENVLLGFTEKPTLVIDSIGGYDIALEESLDKENAYSIVLQGYSDSNSIFAGAIATQSSYRNTLWHSYVNSALQRKKSFKNATAVEGKHARVWIDTTALGSSMNGIGVSKLESIVSATTAGFGIYGIHATRVLSFDLEFFANYGYSESKNMDSTKRKNSLSMNSVTLGMNSTLEIHFVPRERSFFLSTIVFVEFDDITAERQKAATVSSWNGFSTSFGMVAGYNFIHNNFMVQPYASIRGVHTAKTLKVFEDKTFFYAKSRNELFLATGITTAYMFTVGIKPYFTVGLEGNVLDTTKGAVFVSGEELSYTPALLSGDIRVGVEYVAPLGGSCTLELGIELGTRVTLYKDISMQPFAGVELGIRF